MGGWAQWAIPLIGLAVWIISSLVKNQQEEARRRLLNPPRPDEADAAREGQPNRENPFLEEIRRRQMGQRQPPPARPQPVQEKPRKPRLVVERVRQPEPVRSSRRPDPGSRSIPEAIILSEPIALPAAHIAPTATTRPPTKAIQSLHLLLKNRHTLVTAFLLTEVLSQPKCKRKR